MTEKQSITIDIIIIILLAYSIILSFIIALKIQISVETGILIVSIIIAVIAIFGTIYTARQTRNHIRSQIILRIREKYSEREMLEGMKEIKNWYKNHTSVKDAVDDFIENRYKKDEDAYEIDYYRRIFSHYLLMIYNLFDDGIIKEKFVKLIVKEGNVKFLKEYVEPLELAITDEEDLHDLPPDREVFNFFYDLYPDLNS